MGIQFSIDVRNARLDAFEATVGTDAVMKIFDGTKPVNCAASDDGTVLATLTLPTDWMAAATGGAKAMAGTWQDASADNTGTASYFRIYASDGTTCHQQGSVTITGGGGDMTVDNPSFGAGQKFSVTAYTLTDGNA